MTMPGLWMHCLGESRATCRHRTTCHASVVALVAVHPSGHRLAPKAAQRDATCLLQPRHPSTTTGNQDASRK